MNAPWRSRSTNSSWAAEVEFTLLGSAALAVGGLYAMLWWEARRGNAADCTRNLWDVALGAIIAGVFVGRIATMLGDGVNPIANPSDILIVRAGVSTGWATVAAFATVGWLGRGGFWLVADGLAAAALAALAGWHAGCLTRDACLGTVTDVPWAMTQPGSAIGRHPVELYAAMAFAVGAIALAWWRATRPPPPATAAFTALLITGVVRLATEPMRLSLGGGPVWWYTTAVVLGAAGIVWSLRLRGRHAARQAEPSDQT